MTFNVLLPLTVLATSLALIICLSNELKLGLSGFATALAVSYVLAFYVGATPALALVVATAIAASLGVAALQTNHWVVVFTLSVTAFFLALGTVQGLDHGKVSNLAFASLYCVTLGSIVCLTLAGAYAKSRISNSWFVIALRALCSWLLAIAIMIGTLMLA